MNEEKTKAGPSAESLRGTANYPSDPKARLGLAHPSQSSWDMDWGKGMGLGCEICGPHHLPEEMTPEEVRPPGGCRVGSQPLYCQPVTCSHLPKKEQVSRGEVRGVLSSALPHQAALGCHQQPCLCPLSLPGREAEMGLGRSSS